MSPNPYALAAVLILLLAFGAAYNRLTEWLEQKRYAEGFTALLVVGGVLVTVIVSTFLIGWQSAALVLACFAASGLPMTLGSIWRYVRAREAMLRRLIADIKAEMLK